MSEDSHPSSLTLYYFHIQSSHHHPLLNKITSTVIPLESSMTLKNSIWHGTIKVALDRSSWLTLLLHCSRSNYCIACLCYYQYYMTVGPLSVTKHISDACRVSVCQDGSLRHVLSVKYPRKFIHSSSWFPLPLQVHHGEMVQLEKLLST